MLSRSEPDLWSASSPWVAHAGWYELLAPLGMSSHKLALALRVPAARMNDIANEKRGITADTALRLSRYFGTRSRF
jgi:addiction module HigA family antidote